MAGGLQFRWEDKQLRKLYRNASKAAKTTISAINQRTVTAMGIAVHAEVVKKTPIGVTASLRGSIDHHSFKRGNRHIAEVFSAGVPYAQPVEEGRKPGKMPPYRALILWVEKVILGRGKGQKAGKSRRKAAASIAYLIARKIGKRGTKGAHMFQKGLLAAKRNMNAILRSRVKAIERAILRGK